MFGGASLEGEEFTSSPGEASSDQREGAGHKGDRTEHKSHGFVSKIEKSEHNGKAIDGHHKLTIEHRHLDQPSKAGHDFGPSHPESTIHMPEGHGLQVGDHVQIHVKPYNDASDQTSDEGE